MSFSLELSQLFHRDLSRLLQELEAFPDSATLWQTLPGIANSAGNLTLHLEGNLRDFIGRMIGHHEYTRQREFEFSAKDLPRENLIHRIDETRSLISSTVATMPADLLDRPFPSPISGARITHRQALFHIYSHFSYHLGQIDYLRRALTGHHAIDLASLGG